MMRRRLIPVVAALVILAASIIPVSLGWIDESTAIRWTLLLVSGVFAVLAVVFAAMRIRMGTTRTATLFGIALIDFMVAGAILCAALCYLFCAAYLYARGVDLTACRPHRDGTIDPVACLEALEASRMPNWLTIANRAAVATLGMLGIGTGVAVLFEMSRTGPTLTVHVPPPEDRVIYSGPERRAKDRRAGWPPSKGETG